MIIVDTIQQLRSTLEPYRKQGQRVALVPTMGFLHEGHLSLVDEAKARAEIVVMSIFVNPTQFGPGEDFESYPRDLEKDQAQAMQRGVSILFAPSAKEMYPAQSLTTVSVSEVTDRLCGASRPGHFDGVATVVTKLFNIVQPDFACFGMKDAQQLAVIQRFVQDLNMSVEIIPCPIVREADGLALSSRNVYLNMEERSQAVVLNEALTLAEQALQTATNGEAVKEQVRSLIETKPLAKIDYVELLTYPSLEPIEQLETAMDCIVALAVRFGKTRLIDNRMITIKRGERHVSDNDER
ncbi:pantoate--beta-alanine ligase [Ammoniphilus oxalaticus]|uniref:Pantothenate synthetase n=1 Tax=Ammoniphilus oxalaticus TaxID=66863 RepID=A0A419SN94_9BACL|nr:pantoate--beta-alanine ligase [Ammoniphilus oxalaticus]RKD25747.1 pantoate--beta-alanine ligase [Ammoniphilus oxalaticus]